MAAERDGPLALPVGLCSRCGLVGQHPTWAHCVDALRDIIARLTLRSKTPYHAPARRKYEPSRPAVPYDLLGTSYALNLPRGRTIPRTSGDDARKAAAVRACLQSKLDNRSDGGLVAGLP